jgi:hypothetical protein
MSTTRRRIVTLLRLYPTILKLKVSENQKYQSYPAETSQGRP